MFARLVVCAVVVLTATAVFAADKEIKPEKLWKGRISPEQKKAFDKELITSKEDLAKLWEAWKVEGKAPEVDFTKQVVITGTHGGSGFGLNLSLDDKGDLKVIGIGTADIRPDFAYQVLLVNREGIKTVKGKELK